MGTNYYIIKRSTNETADKLWKARNVVINNTKFSDIITNIINNKFSKVIKLAYENNLDDIVDRFEERLIY